MRLFSRSSSLICLVVLVSFAVAAGCLPQSRRSANRTAPNRTVPNGTIPNSTVPDSPAATPIAVKLDWGDFLVTEPDEEDDGQALPMQPKADSDAPEGTGTTDPRPTP